MAQVLLLTTLILTSLSREYLRVVLAWNPATDDLNGTDSSTNNKVVGLRWRFNIDGGPTGTYGMQKGQDSESIALLMKMIALSGSSGFKVGSMSANDQYEIDFEWGDYEFAIMFRATGASAGNMTIFYKPTGTPTWFKDVTFTQSSIQSGTEYHDSGTQIGFVLTDSTVSADGSVKLIASKDYLISLGATGNTITGIFSATFEGGDGSPGSGGATPSDRCPSTGNASWSLGAVPEFPLGPTILMTAMIAVYIYLRRRWT